MATIFDYKFDNMSRLGFDDCDISQRNLQNVKNGNYTTTNYFVNECNMSKPINFATNQPNVFYNGGYETGAGGCNIDVNSNLKIGSIQTNPRCRISLYERPFKTVPYLGRGPVNPVLESQIQQGDFAKNKKSISGTTEKSYINYHHYPLIPSLKATINNPTNLIEYDADSKWVRGGVHSRHHARNNDYIHN